jgi:hypothetical protein
MMEKFIFWQQALRVAGPAAPTQAEARLRAMLSTRRFSMQDRLAGSLNAHRVRAWKTSTAAFAGDIVEFEGSLRPDREGTVIEGRLRYKTRSRIQFIGLLAMGLGFLVIGAFQRFSGMQPGGDLLATGAVVSFISLLSIYASSQMRHTQTEFIEARLNEAVAA